MLGKVNLIDFEQLLGHHDGPKRIDRAAASVANNGRVAELGAKLLERIVSRLHTDDDEVLMRGQRKD